MAGDVMTWRPIETAPQNGTTIDLWIRYVEGEGGYRITNARWDRESGQWQDWAPGDCGDMGWRQLDWQHLITHWMPLPEPPADTKGGE